MNLPDRLRRGRLFFYAAPALPLAIPIIPAFVMLPSFYAKTVGLGLAATGAMLLSSRAFDMIGDPVIGLLSDRWRTPLGRRKPWIILGGIVAATGLLRLFDPPDAVGPLYLLLWSAVLYLGWSMISIPYTAWGAELSDDYHERTRITGAREGLGVVGIVTAGVVPLVTAGLGWTDRAGLAATAWVAIILGASSLAVALTRVPERDFSEAPAPSPGSWWRVIADVAAEGPAVRLLAAWTINGLSSGLSAALLPLFLDQVLRASQFARAALILIYFLSAVAAVPLWLYLSRYGKHRAWCWAMILACASFGWTPFLGAGDILPFGIICVIAGACVGADLSLPPAMQADVIDYDALRHGRRRAGWFFALWGMATKLALALAVGIAFPALAWLGVAPNGPNDAHALAALSFGYGGVPVLFKLGVIALVWNYPITERRQKAIRRRLERRQLQLGGAPQRSQT